MKTKILHQHNCLRKCWKLSLLPKFWGPPKSGALGLSLFSLVVNPHLHVWGTSSNESWKFTVGFSKYCFRKRVQGLQDEKVQAKQLSTEKKQFWSCQDKLERDLHSTRRFLALGHLYYRNTVTTSYVEKHLRITIHTNSVHEDSKRQQIRPHELQQLSTYQVRRNSPKDRRPRKINLRSVCSVKVAAHN